MANSNVTWLGITGIAQFKEMGSILHKGIVQIAKPTQQGNNDAPMISKHGSPVRPDAQIVALRAHCA